MSKSNDSKCTERKANKLEQISSVKISLASPEEIRSWSSGEVTVEVAFDARKGTKDGSFEPRQIAKNGLLCQRIFGPVASYRCECGNYRGGKRAREHEEEVCEECGIVIADRKVRRERMGHIELAAPVVHPFFFHGSPSILAELLSATVTAEQASKIEGRKANKARFSPQVVKDVIFRERSFVIGDDGEEVAGPEGIRQLLRRMNVGYVRACLEEAVKEASTNQKKSTLATLLEGVVAEEDGEVCLEWMVMDVIPVIPPVLRRVTVMKTLDDKGEERVDVGDLNRLYGRVIRTNNALKELLELGAPKELVRRRQRSLQRAVNSLFENEGVSNPVRTLERRPLVSLLGLLKGKTGRFRGSLLGKRVDYSGRGVIVVNPNLKLWECGLPFKMALELYKPFLVRCLESELCQSEEEEKCSVASVGDEEILTMLKEAKEVAQGEIAELLAMEWKDLRNYIAKSVRRCLIESGIPGVNAAKLKGVVPVDDVLKQTLQVALRGRSKLKGNGSDSLVDWLKAIADRELEKSVRGIVVENVHRVMEGHAVLLNRAPTLHRMNVQAFQPKLVSGNAIELHPLVCKGFGADFDGDQMAVHLPLCDKSLSEARDRLMCDQNVLSPANGSVVYRATQDMVLGLYYLTMDSSTEKAIGAFSSSEEVALLRETKDVKVQEPILLRVPRGKEVRNEVGYEGSVKGVGRIETTVGRALFNRSLPSGMPFYNKALDSSDLEGIIKECCERLGPKVAVEIAQDLASLGFEEATRSGLSFGMEDLLIPKEKEVIVESAKRCVDDVKEQQHSGKLSEREASEKIVKVWSGATDEVACELMKELRTEERADGSVNPVLVMAESGARGSVAQLKQLSGMRGLMARANGDVVKEAVTSNFREGLSPREFFITTHGARKSFIDVRFHTSEGGYLTRRLVHAASRVVVSMEDCGTTKSVAKRDGEPVGLGELVLGRVSSEDVKQEGRVLLKRNGLITPEISRALGASRRKQLRVRSVLTCEAPVGVCAHCYGMDLSKGELVEEGGAIGVLAAQSIGEPGTQLTMQTKHTGGIAAGKDMAGGLSRIEELFEARCPELREMFESKRKREVVSYLVRELQAPFREQKVAINEKHFEVIIREMLGKIRVVNSGDTRLVAGKLISKGEFQRLKGPAGKGRLAVKGEEQLLGITQLALWGESFLAAAGFGEPKQVLRRAALCCVSDSLSGITENVVVGGLIRAGSGYSTDGQSDVIDCRDKQKKRGKSKRGKVTKQNRSKEKLRVLLGHATGACQLDDIEVELELEELVLNLTGGEKDAKAWDRIIELSWEQVFGVIRSASQIEEHIARRLTNKTFRRVMEKGRCFSSYKKFWYFVWQQRDWQIKSYLRNETKRRMRERGELLKLMERDEGEMERERKAEDAIALLGKIREEAKLNAHQRAVFDYAWGESMSDEEIAERLGKTNGAIRKTKHYIKQKLRDTPTIKEMREK